MLLRTKNVKLHPSLDRAGDGMAVLIAVLPLADGNASRLAVQAWARRHGFSAVEIRSVRALAAGFCEFTIAVHSKHAVDIKELPPAEAPASDVVQQAPRRPYDQVIEHAQAAAREALMTSTMTSSREQLQKPAAKQAVKHPSKKAVPAKSVAEKPISVEAPAPVPETAASEVASPKVVATKKRRRRGRRGGRRRRKGGISSSGSGTLPSEGG